MLEQSITTLAEGPLVKKLLNHPFDREALFNIEGIPAVGADEVHQQVPLARIRPSLVGDVDILVLPADAPTDAVAIQVKCLPFVIGVHDVQPYHWDRMSRRYAKAVRQANRNARHDGFAQVYLWIFVTVDTRDRNGGRWLYDGPDSNFDARVREIVSRRGLDPRVGLIVFEWVQPMDRPALEFGTGGTHLLDLATPAAQPADLTDGLRALIASESASAQARNLPRRR